MDVLQPVHLLWINLVTDTLPAIALGVEPAEPGIMTHKPRGRQSNFFDGGVFGAIMYQGVFQTILVLAVYGWGLVFPEHHTQCRNSCRCPYNGLCNTWIDSVASCL